MAGGRGEVAFILHTVKGIPTTLIDPRPQKLSKKQHAQLQALAAGDPAQGRPSVYVTRQVCLWSSAPVDTNISRVPVETLSFQQDLLVFASAPALLCIIDIAPEAISPAPCTSRNHKR